MQQTITSAATSINQVPAMFKRIPWKPCTRNLDLGGGKYDLATQYLEDQHHVLNLVLDPFNRSQEHNQHVVNIVSIMGVDTVTIANVLNVIPESYHRLKLLQDARKALPAGGTVYISCYEGDGTGIGRETTKGWQENRKLKTYLGEVRQIFPNAILWGSMIIGIKEA